MEDLVKTIFNRKDGVFVKYLISKDKNKEFIHLKEYVSKKYRQLKYFKRWDANKLKEFKEVDKIEDKYGLPTQSLAVAIVKEFVCQVWNFPSSLDIEEYMNKNDLNFLQIHTTLMDPIVKEFFESLPIESWVPKELLEDAEEKTE